MFTSQPECGCCSKPESSTCLRFGLPVALLLLIPAFTRAQSVAPNQAQTVASCPIEFLRFNPSAVSVRIRNAGSKAIVGLVFNVALADATERWKWLHWDFDDLRPVREFAWSKTIKSGSAKTLSWDRAYLDFEHGGGGAFVLTSVLFEDGSIWEESSDRASCKYVWYNHHKKAFARPVELPFRP
jgi:hypothetical protein